MVYEKRYFTYCQLNVSFSFGFAALSDYLESEHTGSFPSGSVPGDERCVSVNTFFDRAVENTETFLVQLDSFDAVIVTDGTAIANIQDNDGKFV